MSVRNPRKALQALVERTARAADRLSREPGARRPRATRHYGKLLDDLIRVERDLSTPRPAGDTYYRHVLAYERKMLGYELRRYKQLVTQGD